ncbi:MAG: polysaccharide biosynthesis/export family protein [Bacteroidota bacterium]
MNQILTILCLALLFSSCATKKEILYFQDAELLNQQMATQSFEPIIENNDILHIAISSMNEEVLAPFKRNTGLEGNINNNNPGLQGYLVSSEGSIQFPVLGTVAVAGKTRGQVQTELKSLLSEFITDVVVDVRIMNFKVTVMGEVKAPGVYNIADERITLPQALGRAGDLTEDGKRGNILVIREIDGKQQVARIDITKTEFFTGPYYFLKQNDVVYVEPSLRGVKKSGFIPDIPALLSLFTVVLSGVIILTR